MFIKKKTQFCKFAKSQKRMPLRGFAFFAKVLCFALQWTKVVEVRMSDCPYLRSNINRNTSMSQNALRVVDKYGKQLLPGALYTWTGNRGCFWQSFNLYKHKDPAKHLKARLFFGGADVLVFKHLDSHNLVEFEVNERRHPTYGVIKFCSFKVEDVARYVIPAHRDCIRNPGRILNASTGHLKVGNQITVNPDYACICLLHSTPVCATRYMLDDKDEIYVTKSDEDHFSIRFRKNSGQDIHIPDIFAMNAHLFVTERNGGGIKFCELQIARIREQYETELQTIQSKSSEAFDKIQKQMAQDCKLALRNMQDRVMSIAGNALQAKQLEVDNALQAKQLEVDELKKQLAKAEKDRSDQAWSTVVELAQSSEQSSNGVSNRSAAQTATRDGRRDAMTYGSRGQDVSNGGSQKRGKNTDDLQNAPDWKRVKKEEGEH